MPENNVVADDFGVASWEQTLNAIKGVTSDATKETPPAGTEGTAEVKAAETPAEAVTPEATTEAVPAEGVTPAPATAAPAEVISPKLRRLLEKEAQIIAREQALTARETKAAPEPAPAAPVNSFSLAQLQARFRADPEGLLAQLDPNFKKSNFAKRLWVSELGEHAPPEQRAQYEAEAARGGIEQLRYEMEESKQQILQELNQRQAEMAYQQYLGAVQTFAKDQIPDSCPLTAKFASKDPDRVVQAIVGVTRKHANATGGEILSPAQAAAKLEASLKKLQFVDQTPVVKAPEPAPEVAVAAPTSLRNKHTVVQPNRIVDDSLDDDKLRAKALAEIEKIKKGVTAG